LRSRRGRRLTAVAGRPRIAPTRGVGIKKSLTSSFTLLQGGDPRLRLLERLAQKQRTLHEEVRRIGLLFNGLCNQPFSFRVLVDTADLGELGQKAFEHGSFLGSHEPPSVHAYRGMWDQADIFKERSFSFNVIDCFS
jgi:hypothetical protein